MNVQYNLVFNTDSIKLLKESWRRHKLHKSPKNIITNNGIITSLNHLLRRNQVEWSVGPSNRLILDSGTDYALAGHSCLVIKRRKIFLS